MLASRGFIAVSVDENFLNYSVWSGIPSQDMKVRAWMLLKHLQQIDAFQAEPGTPFFDKVDIEKVALLGHSRGGQAAAMAADRDRWFEEDRTLSGIDRLVIRAVIGIAPTDRSVDKTFAVLHDVNYLTVQGARDADVNNFYGDRQYIRTSFSGGSDLFKASVYIADANHSRFNSDWGIFDDSLPAALFLNVKDMMSGAEQRRAAKVYVAAFLETALHGNETYEAMFGDYRTGLDWLPESRYFSRYESGAFQQIARYDGEVDKTTPGAGVQAFAKGVTSWTIASALDRDRNEKGTKGLVLEWKDDAAYSLLLADAFWKNKKRGSIGDASALMFSLSNLERNFADGSSLPLPQITVELEDTTGTTAKLPLDRFMKIQPLPHITFGNIPALEHILGNGKYTSPVEPVFQTYVLPLRMFQTINPELELGIAQLHRITFHFAGGPGKVMLDDLGLSPIS
jgi:hypothetical protein